MSTSIGPATLSAPTASALAFFDRVRDAYEQAAHAAGGMVERTYAIAGQPVRLCFAGPTLLPSLTPSLAHLAAPLTLRPALTVRLWESAATGVPMPPPAWSLDDYGAAGEVHGFGAGRIQVVVQYGATIVSVFDAERNEAVYWVKSASQIPTYERAAPLRIILQMWAGAQGMQLTHAGAVGRPEGGVLLAGKGGSGKSNTALACLASPLAYVSDDYCLLDPAWPTTIHSLYSSAKTHARDIERLAFLQAIISNPEELGAEKALYFLHDWRPEKLLPGFPLRAVLMPRVADQEATTLTPASPGAALAALAPSTMLLAPSAARETFARLGAVVRRVPCYVLNLGREAAGIPPVISAVLDDSLARSGAAW